MKSENTYKLTNIINFLIDRKLILYAIISCLISLAVILIGMFVCDKNLWNYLYIWILPGTGIVLFGTYAVSMTDRHPIILIFPPIIFFASLFIRYLVTYDYLIFFFLFLQALPFAVFWVNILKKNLFAETHMASVIGILSASCILFAIAIVSIFDYCEIISLPLCEHAQLKILIYVELAIAGLYTAIGFVNKDMRIST